MKKNYFKNLMQVSLLLGAAFVISSCDDVIGQEDNPVASYVQWEAKTPKSIELTLGIKGLETDTVKAVAVSSVVIVYESENPEIAKVDPVTGVITAVGVGETYIKAVVTGASSAGQSVFIPEEIKIPVVVKDGKAKLTRVKDEVIEFTANNGSKIDLQKLFTAYPEVGTGADKSAIKFTLLGKNTKSTTPSADLNNIATLNGNKLQIEDGYDYITDWNGKGKDISDTVYVAAKINGNAGSQFIYTDAKATEDTVMFVINKSIAFINKEGKREILTADKYKELDLTKTSAVEAGTYYVTKAPASYPSVATDIKGDVTLIFKNAVTAKVQNLDDKTDNATLNIFGEAIATASSTPAKPEYEAWNPTIDIKGATDNAITNFKEINIYTGTITVNKAITAVKDVNVNAGTLRVYPGTSGYAIKLSGNLTINGGSVTANGTGTDTDNGFAVIGKVVYNKGSFYAYNDDYRAVNGTLTAASGFEFLQGDTSAKSKATKLEGTTSNSKYIWGQAVPKK